MAKNSWSDGDSVTATQLNRMEDQLVIQCTSGTRPTGVEGQRIYQTDNDRELVYTGAAWEAVFSKWASFTPSWSGITAGNATQSAEYAYTTKGLIVRGSGMAERAMDAQAEAQKQAQQYAQQVVEQSGGGGGQSASEQIAHAKELLDSGAINQDEYDKLKAKALG